MLKDKLIRVLEESRPVANALFIRTLLKEVIQDELLAFVYQHQQFKSLIFTGGTCLRKLYKLPRLSEDLDFNFLSAKPLSVPAFAKAVKEYVSGRLQYKSVKVRTNVRENTVFVNFPILAELGLVASRADTPNLFVRCDFAEERTDKYATEARLLSTKEQTFFVLAYDLPTLFANKISAFLERNFFKGKLQTVAFKGRDAFDLMWFCERSAQEDFTLQPRWDRLLQTLPAQTKRDVVKLLQDKIQRLDAAGVQQDLLPFIESQQFIKEIEKNFSHIIMEWLRHSI